VGATYTHAADRTSQHTTLVPGRLANRSTLPIDLRLLAVSLLAMIAVALTAAGKLSALRFTEPAAASPPVNLSQVADAHALEIPLAQVFDDPDDRRFAATALFAGLRPDGGDKQPVPNVGSLSRVQVSLGAIRRARGLERFQERARAIAGVPAAGRDGMLPVLTSAELATLKPSLSVRTRRDFVKAVVQSTALYVLAFQVPIVFWWWRKQPGDRVLLAAAHALTAIGLCAMIARPDPLRDWLLFPRYVYTIVAGVAVMALVAALDFRSPRLRQLTYVPLLAAATLSLLLILFGRGPGGSSARVNLGPVQPIEAIRLLVLLFLAGYFARRWELLRELRQPAFRSRVVPSWLDVPRIDYALPVVGGVALALLLLFVQRDLGPALILGLTFLALYAIARGRAGMPIAGLVLLLFGFYASYRLHIPPTVVERVSIWQSPWDNAVRGGDQVAHAMWSLASGGPLGTGLGLGATRYLPAGHTDLILASLGEELGAWGLAMIAALYVAICWRAYRIARRASTDYEFFLAAGAMLLLAIPTILMASAMVGAVPLTGVVTPFLSYGGSAMLANFAALGMLASVRGHGAGGEGLQVFDAPLRWTGLALAALAAVPIVDLVNVQVRSADLYAIKPHLGLQADGSRRYAYNPRVLDVVRQIPRGTIYDRAGLPLATDDARVKASTADAYRKAGLDAATACADGDSRCYPLEGRTFHLLGDARTHLNWSASNTSFIERDDEARLRGFDDRATDVQVKDASGAPAWTVRRDFTQVLPLLRHRFEPDHPAVRALLARSRDVHLTIDSRLQVRVGDIVAKYASASAVGRAAAVVVDADSGDLLASVSYPWPAGSTTGVDTSNQASLLDRARFGLYPPGSTFKLVTAAAALRQNVHSSERKYTCVPLPDGRVGARIAGWSRPVRDDIKDRTAHGTIDMHSALVVSCNAYFAQLALEVGPQALAETARALNVALARENSMQRIRNTLPQIGYGQGEVVVTPMKMAQVAAAIAAGGRISQIQPERDQGGEVDAGEFLRPSAARLLASYMRDVVVSGTGRSLRDSVVPIAGKTGTAEIAGADSHAWFAGFAPYGPAAHHIAFAVIIEHAGYGGTAAAPAAGEIVSAAAALGLLK
jgi:cell division protein FtsW (lipid II flippase)